MTCQSLAPYWQAIGLNLNPQPRSTILPLKMWIYSLRLRMRPTPRPQAWWQAQKSTLQHDRARHRQQEDRSIHSGSTLEERKNLQKPVRLQAAHLESNLQCRL